jgi:hypothetical protein
MRTWTLRKTKSLYEKRFITQEKRGSVIFLRLMSRAGMVEIPRL